MSGEGFEIEAVHDGPRGLERALSREHSLVVLDLMLPGMGGLDVLRRVREQSPIPVLILTARGEDVDRILGLEIGRTIIFPSPSIPASCLPGFAQSCGAAFESRLERILSSPGTCVLILPRVRRGSKAGSSHSPA